MKKSIDFLTQKYFYSSNKVFYKRKYCYTDIQYFFMLNKKKQLQLFYTCSKILFCNVPSFIYLYNRLKERCRSLQLSESHFFTKG